MESARRASEIHKRRCGRSFRITEEAVLNEEMYEEEDPDYGQRVSRLYAAFAQDAALMHQQWMNTQRIRVDQVTGKFIINTPPMQNAPAASPTTPSEPTPFFAYQPGAQPSSMPIRATEQSTMNGTVTGQKQSSAESVLAPHPLNPGQIQNQARQISHFQQAQPPKQAVHSPAALSPMATNSSNHSNQSASLDMFEDRSNPYPAQLHLFTYPSPDLNGYNLNYSYNPNLNSQLVQTSASGSVPQSHMPTSCNMRSPTGTPNTPASSQYQGGISGDEFLTLSSQFLKGSEPQFSQPPVSLSSTMQKKTEQAFQSMRQQMSTLYETPVLVKSENDLYTPFFTGEETNELAYDDWLEMPGGSQ
jgi:hypothetical protein